MRLIRMKLDNWRGVRSREIRFADGVTVVEGPNEIGKSRIIEALDALINTLDSSNAQAIRALQPVGEDVGSRVEVELKAGAYHLVYAKTYNKGRTTTLDVLAPDKRQLTGRQAHETVERMLGETVDLALFKALLLVQGEKIAPAKLQHSSSLAAALDEAAARAAGDTAGADAGDHDSLVDAVRAEYERYFTPKTGRPRYDDVEQAHAAADEARAAARKALDEVQQDAGRRQGQATELRRLDAAVPDLESQLAALAEAFESVRALEADVAAKTTERHAAQAALDDAELVRQSRREQAEELAGWRKRLDTAADGLAPLEADTASAAARLATARTALDELAAADKLARRSLAVARADLDQLHRDERLVAERQRLDRLDRISEEIRSHLDAVNAITVTDEVLAVYRQAAQAMEMARSKRDLAATTIAVTARRHLSVEIDDEAIELAEGEELDRVVSSELGLSVPGVVDVRVTPPQSVAELDRELADATEALQELAARHDAPTLDAAVEAHAMRAAAQGNIDRLKAQEATVLDGADRRTIEQRVAELARASDGYSGRRDGDTDMPGSVTEAETRLARATTHHGDTEATLDEARQRLERLDREHSDLDATLRQSQQSLAGLEAGVKAADSSLRREREKVTDDELDARLGVARTGLASIDQALSDLRGRVDQAAPDVARTRLENARRVLEGTRTERDEAKTRLAVLDDRLGRAQADGRYEVLETAERAFEETRVHRDAVRRRAAAAQLLWQTLSAHRDAARATYVEPLKQAIEHLGAVVYGAGFEIELGDDWTIVSRTLDGKTLAFGSLSIGAQEQLGLLARLAAAQIVSSEGGVPLIIDDALGFSDPARLQTMGAAIAAAGKQAQVIVLTCTPGRFMHVGGATVVRLVDE